MWPCKKMLFSILVGLLLPAYQTFKTIKANKTAAYEQVLIRWIMIATFASVCFFSDLFISWLPFFQDLKLVGLFFLSGVSDDFLVITYQRVIHQWLSQHEQTIDNFLEKSKDVYRVKSREFLKWGQNKAITYMNERNKMAPTNTGKRPSVARAQTK